MCERHASRANRILELVNIDAGVDDRTEKLVHDVREIASRHRAVQVADEHSLLRVEVFRCAGGEVVVCQDPRNDLHLDRPSN